MPPLIQNTSQRHEGSVLHMRQTFFSILAGLTLIASACRPSAQPAGGGTGPANVTVATPPPAGGAATPSGAATPTSGAATTPVAGAPTAAGTAAQPTSKPQTNAQPSGRQEITVNALQG